MLNEHLESFWNSCILQLTLCYVKHLTLRPSGRQRVSRAAISSVLPPLKALIALKVNCQSAFENEILYKMC